MMENLIHTLRLARSSRSPRAEETLGCLDRAIDQGIARYGALVGRALSRGDARGATKSRKALERLLEESRAIRSARAAARDLLSRSQPPGEETPPFGESGLCEYWTTSATLALAHSLLTQPLPGRHSEPEWMLAVSGLRMGRVRTLEALIDVRLSSQSAGRASFDMEAFTRVAIALDEHGQALHAIFHSHRFSGPPSPSSVDLQLQRVLEEGGYPAIQAVFSDDGYVRFFAHRPISVHVYGKGAEYVKPNLYHLVHFGTLPHPAVAIRGDRAQ